MASLQEKPRGEFLHETRGLQPAAYTRIPILKHVLKKEVCCGNCLHLNVSIICVCSGIAQTGAEDYDCESANKPTKFSGSGYYMHLQEAGGIQEGGCQAELKCVEVKDEIVEYRAQRSWLP